MCFLLCCVFVLLMEGKRRAGGGMGLFRVMLAVV